MYVFTDKHTCTYLSFDFLLKSAPSRSDLMPRALPAAIYTHTHMYVYIHRQTHIYIPIF